MARTTNHAFAGASLLLDGGMRNQLRLAWRLLRDDRVGSVKFAVPALVGLYIASPVDPIPDFLLGLGQLDDFGVAVAAVMLMVRLMPLLAPRHIVDEHLREMAGAAPAEKPAAPAEQVVDATFTVRSR
jgi:uncharacterized membrane protein YkvA (DUF1232 family)